MTRYELPPSRHATNALPSAPSRVSTVKHALQRPSDHRRQSAVALSDPLLRSDETASIGVTRRRSSCTSPSSRASIDSSRVRWSMLSARACHATAAAPTAAPSASTSASRTSRRLRERAGTAPLGSSCDTVSSPVEQTLLVPDPEELKAGGEARERQVPPARVRKHVAGVDEEVARVQRMPYEAVHAVRLDPAVRRDDPERAPESAQAGECQHESRELDQLGRRRGNERAVGRTCAEHGEGPDRRHDPRTGGAAGRERVRRVTTRIAVSADRSVSPSPTGCPVSCHCCRWATAKIASIAASATVPASDRIRRGDTRKLRGG